MILRAAFIISLTLVSANARAQGILAATIQTCAEGDPVEVLMLEALADLGWESKAPPDLVEADFQAIAALRLNHGALPALREPATWDLWVSSARGTANRVILPDQPIQRHWLSRPHSASFLRVSVFEFPELNEVSCEIIVTSDIIDNDFYSLANDEQSLDVGQFILTPNLRLEHPTSEVLINTLYFQAPMIEELIQAEFPFLGRVALVKSHSRQASR